MNIRIDICSIILGESWGESLSPANCKCWFGKDFRLFYLVCGVLSYKPDRLNNSAWTYLWDKPLSIREIKRTRLTETEYLPGEPTSAVSLSRLDVYFTKSSILQKARV